MDSLLDNTYMYSTSILCIIINNNQFWHNDKNTLLCIAQLHIESQKGKEVIASEAKVVRK